MAAERKKGRSADGRWRLGFALAVALCALALALNAGFGEIRPGSRWGVGYGIAATVLMLTTALFGVRRRCMRLVSRLGLGSARTWLYLHLYGGALFLLLTLMHTGFQLPNAALTWWLWLLAVWTVLSGLLGLGLQRWIPRLLATGLATEVIYERIPELVEELRGRAEALAGQSGDPVRALYARRVAPALAGPRRRLGYYLDVTGGIGSRLREFDYLHSFLPPAEGARLRDLERLYRTKLEIDAHYTLQHALRWWLYLHVPTSLALLALVAVHVYTVLYY